MTDRSEQFGARLAEAEARRREEKEKRVAESDALQRSEIFLQQFSEKTKRTTWQECETLNL